MTSLRSQLDLNAPLDAAVWAVLTVTFFAVARLGELVLPRLNSFDPSRHVARKHVRMDKDREGHEVWVIFVPRTKSSESGEDLCFAKQSASFDPVSALTNHLTLNDPKGDAALFSYRTTPAGSDEHQWRPLTKRAFNQRVVQAAKAAALTQLQGHSLHIGGTLEYLLRGIPFDVVKTMGRWKSDAFRLYLRKHAQILAPYLQAEPVIQENFTCYVMPPVR
ncbi:hypothetical protein DAEQUDRAFT_685389 [Daedalea quercina L-15889]|uniref:Tyr recombinase domain-containing protein n=1 Tax=Daedalea quercina L-15889 TaxID=1314783 RepID=A0A165T604_9APHY|nr:hypothetical protein DAEQUDRAFT_685389 [Daedalea quercina L-15889]